MKAVLSLFLPVILRYLYPNSRVHFLALVKTLLIRVTNKVFLRLTIYRGNENALWISRPHFCMALVIICLYLPIYPLHHAFALMADAQLDLKTWLFSLNMPITTKNTPRYLNQATVVGALVLPFGSFRKLPPTGFGSPSIFLGLTASHNAIEWYLFGSPGVLITTPHHGTKFGNLFFYQTGFGRNITYVPKELIFMWMIELFGIYRQRDKINYAINPNSGSHIFSIGPSLWLSTQRVILQAGASFPLYQHFNGNQKEKLLLVFSLRRLEI